MNVPILVVAEIYDILCEFGETPKASRETFFSFCSKGLVFDYGFDCNSCTFTCIKPFSCFVKPISIKPNNFSVEKLQEMNDKLNYLSNKYQKTLAFW